MTTFGKYLSQIKPIPGFDSEKWLRKRRAEIQRENEGMTDTYGIFRQSLCPIESPFVLF